MYLRGQSDWGTVQERSAQNLLCVIKNRSHITASHSYSKNIIHPQYTSYCHQTTANLQCSSNPCSRTVETQTERERERGKEGGRVREREWVGEWVSGCVMRNADRLQHVAKCPFPHIWWDTLQLKEKFLFKWYLFLSLVCLFVHKLP